MPFNSKKFLQTVSTKPGVYCMLDASGQILYVGKARNLKKRLKSYFRKQLDSRKTEALMSQICDINVMIAASDTDALLLESNLIKQHRPRYNVLLRDDKSYPYLFLSTESHFPRLDYHRGAKKRKGRYFGPYPSAGSVRENLALIQKLFKLRQCRDSFFNNRSRPCLQYQINRCTAPCVGYVSAEDYDEQVQDAVLFLEGKNEQVLRRLTEKMDAASQEKAYEQAAHYRDQIKRLRKLQTQQAITGDEGNIDIISMVEKMGEVAIGIIYVRGGRVIGHKVFYPKVPKGMDLSAILSEFIPQYYLSPLRDEEMLDQVIVSEALPEKNWIETALKEKYGGRFRIEDKRVARARQWVLMAKTNAVYGLAQHLAEKNHVTSRLMAFQATFDLPNPIQRIDCFDVSHTQGEATVASCVVYGVDGAEPKNYRRFNIKDITPGDDYAALKQALSRRYTRLKEGDGMLPDVLMIDGGPGQLEKAREVMEELQITGVELIGVAKGVGRKAGMEKIYRVGLKQPRQLAPDDLVSHLVQFIRDEAHRFAITAHRAKRGKTRNQSPLECVEGIGAKRRRDLLRHFGGIQALRKASMEDIAKVPGISVVLAERIYDVLH